jgi:predicted secreted hydrolase
LLFARGIGDLATANFATTSAPRGFGLAEAAEETTDVRSTTGHSGSMTENTSRGSQRRFSVRPVFHADATILLEGDQGFSRKGHDLTNASYYYSQPQLAVAGSVDIAGRNTDVTGKAWLDHEWSSEAMATAASGWDWSGINLHDGGALMAFRMRDRAGNELWTDGMLRAANGASTRLEPTSSPPRSGVGVRRAPASSTRSRCGCALAPSITRSSRSWTIRSWIPA